MDFNNVIERRIVDGEKHKLVLEMSANEYKEDYDEFIDDYAMNILESYLQFRGDDGRVEDAKIEYDPNTDIVRITAKVNYLDNEHTRHIF